MNKIICIPLFICLSVFLFSCGPAQFKESLSPIEEAKVDKRLKGVWVEEQEDNIVYLHIYSRKSGIADFILLGKDSDEKAGIMEYEMFPTKIGNSDFMNLKMVTSKSYGKKDKRVLSKTYILAKYKIENNILTIWYADKDKIAESIKRKYIKGKTAKDKVTVTDSRENIFKFFDLVKEEKIFEKFGEFRKIQMKKESLKNNKKID
jgi:hypothetical protein